MKILIMKKSETASLTLVNQMLKRGHDVESAVDDEKGYQKYLETRPDIIICDIALNGLEFSKKIRNSDKITGIVLLVPQNDPQYLLESVKYDIKFFIEPLEEIYIGKILESFRLLFEQQIDGSKDSKILDEYKKVVDASSIVSKTNTKGIITFINDEFCTVSGYRREELIGKNHNIVRHPNMPAAAFEDLWKTINSKKIWKGLVENLKKDGSSYFVKATIVPVLDESDNIIEFIGLREDITDLMEKEREIESLNAQNLKTVADKAFSIKTSQLLKSVPIPLVSIDKDNNILEYNDEFHNLFNVYTSNDFLTTLADNSANINDVLDFEQEDDLIDWKDELLTFGDDIEVSFKHESNGRKFSLRIKEDEEDTFIVSFA